MKRIVGGVVLVMVGLTGACKKRGFEGVEECEAYFKTVETCGNTSEKSTLEMALDLEKQAWEQLGSDEVKKQCSDRRDYAKDRCDVGPDDVKECDAYFAIIKGCKDGPAKATQEKNAEQRRNDWKSMPKSQLKKTCKMNADMAKKFCE